MDRAGVGLLVSRGAVARRQAAEARQVLAGAEAVEATDLGAHRPGGNRADGLDGPQPADGGIGLADLFQALLDGADLLADPREAAEALLHHPAGLCGELGLVFDPEAPGRGPAGVAAALAVLAQEGSDGQLEVAALGDELLAVRDEGAELPERAGRDPDAGQVADPFEVGQHAGVGEVGLVRGRLHAADEAAVGHVHGPAEAVGELLGEVGGAGAGFEGGSPDGAEAADGLVDEGGRVRTSAVAEDGTLGVEEADLDGVLGVVEADEQW
jgi:hypothetical protein